MASKLAATIGMGRQNRAPDRNQRKRRNCVHGVPAAEANRPAVVDTTMH